MKLARAIFVLTLLLLTVTPLAHAQQFNIKTHT
ncbi:MAG: hypothetical protein RIR86_1834, partial [Acidobacteriota bacterium]